MVVKFSLWLISVYRRILSPLIGGQCRFHPTCSVYAAQAITRHGAIKGWLLTFLRIMNCHPWSRRQWVDPVPDQFAWKQLVGYKSCRRQKK